MQRTRIKVCCISSVEEAELAVSMGADALGLVGDMPSGPGVIGDERAREIALTVPPAVDTFLLTAYTTAAEIVEHVTSCHASTVQIVQHIDPAEYAGIIARAPQIRRVQVIHVEDTSALALIEPYSPWVHAFLLDSGRPNAPVAELGGTGRTHDWGISAAFVRQSPRPVFLAGGLNPDNIRQAIATVKPFGVDLCSGVRHQQRLDPKRLGRFMHNAWCESSAPDR